MLVSILHRLGLRGDYLHSSAMACIGLCLSLWIRAKAVDQAERGNAERRAIFVGLWPPMLWIIGDALTRHGDQLAQPSRRPVAARLRR